MTHTKDIKNALRSKYAWPGGYPLYLLMSDCEALCIDCARANYKLITHAIMHSDKLSSWHVHSVQINYEDAQLCCCHCNKRIESAYAESEAL